ncbi:MAG: divalent-cation tolerance protein CutA, partial [Acidobacteriota bacterium]
MTSASSEPIAVFLTAANDEEAARLADILVGSHLAACVQILPQVRSVYCWKNKVERQTEVLLIAKTLRSKFEELE